MSASPASQKASAYRRIETQLAGNIDNDVRRNMRIEILSAVLYGLFYSAVLFLPAVLTRMGATPAMISLYLSLSYLGHLSGPLSLLFVRRIQPLNFAVASWAIGRVIFMASGLAMNAPTLVALGTVMWLLEFIPNPIYARIVQAIYPISNRGKILSVVRFGMAFTLLIFTPVAGWALDHLTYHVVFPIAGLFGVASALVFIAIRMRREPAPSPATQRQSPMQALRVVMRNKPFMLFQLSVVLFGVAGLSVNPLFPGVQINRLGLTYTDIGLLGLAQSISWLGGYVLFGRIIDQRGALFCTMIAFALQAVAPFTYAFATAGWMLLPAFIGLGLVSAGADLGLTNSLLELADEGKAQEYAAAQSIVIGARGFVAPFIGVGLLALGMAQPLVFVLAGVVALAGAYVVHLVRRLKSA
jgi:MFS family permease